MQIELVEVKSALNRHKKRDSWFLDDYSVNPYSGCEFGCVYCYTIGSRYGGAPAGVVRVKRNFAEVLARQLKNAARREEFGIIAVGSATEPYMRIEEEFRLTRGTLEVIAENRFPVHILTKSPLVERDFDVLEQIRGSAVLPEDLAGRKHLRAIVTFSFSTLDEGLAGMVEPGAPSPRERFRALSECAKRGIWCGAAFIPVLPFLSDSPGEIDRMIRTAADFGARFVFVGALTLFGGETGCRGRFLRFLRARFPDLADKYRTLFGRRFEPGKEYQNRLAELAKESAEKYGISVGLI